MGERGRDVAVMRVLPSPGRALNIAALAGNIVWLGLAIWVILDKYPSHPAEEG